jgi:hypothetical protein
LSGQLTRRLLSGLLTFVPGGRALTERATGGAGDAAYCYWVWLHHLVLARRNGLSGELEAVAELGPGDSLGTGLAALLSGVDRYYAFDIISYADAELNLRILDQLVGLYEERTPPSQGSRNSGIVRLDEFPGEEVGEAELRRTLAPERIGALRAAIEEPGSTQDGVWLSYEPDWLGTQAAPHEQPQLLISQAVLEHVDDLAGTYAAMHRWLPEGGLISHEIDFRSHDFAREWNGQWTFSDATWRLIRGRRRYAINREPLSTHLRLIEAAGFRVVYVKRLKKSSTIGRGDLAPRFREMPDEDLTTSTALVQAVKDPT